MEITKQQAMILGMVLIGLSTIGGITYSVFNTGNELTCGTNKPIGWVIDADHGNWYEAHCPFVSKEWLYVNCSSFRSTNSYERYGCAEALIIPDEQPKDDIPKIDIPKVNKDNSIICDKTGCRSAS